MSAVLTDIPGPKARIRYAAYGVVGTVVLLGLIGFVLYRLIATGQFDGNLWDWVQYTTIQEDILGALLETVKAFALGAVLALAFGATLAVGKLSDHKWISIPANAVVELFRAIPLLILMYIFFFGLNSVGISVTPYFAVVFSLMLYNGSVLAEVFRAGILSIPHGQSEAAYALGMRKTQVMVQILLPQALRAMLPTIVSQLVVLLKDTALGSLILFQELLYYFRFVGSQGQFHRPIVPAAIILAILYIGLCLLLSALARYLEKRNRRSKKHIALEETDTNPALVE
jgi:glutamate transport system permease protein